MTNSEKKGLQEGDSVPDLKLRVIEHGAMREVEAEDLFGSKTVVLFALPGAFTPTCSSQHLPRYEELAPRFRQHGVDMILCLSVNDSFVMTEWGRDQGVSEVMLVADGNGEFSSAMGLLIDGSRAGMGQRSRRYSMLVRDGIIEKMFLEPEEGGDPYGRSDADTMLKHLVPHLRPAPHIAMLSKPGCVFCAKAKKMLDDHGLRYIEIALPDATRGRALAAIAGETTAPQIFIDAHHVGGSEALGLWLENYARRQPVPATA